MMKLTHRWRKLRCSDHPKLIDIERAMNADDERELVRQDKHELRTNLPRRCKVDRTVPPTAFSRLIPVRNYDVVAQEPG